MHIGSLFSASALLFCSSVPCFAPDSVVWLDSLPLDNVQQDFGTAHVGQTVEGKPLTLGGKVYEHGLGTHSNSVFMIPLDGKAERFEAMVGVDDKTAKPGSVTFKVVVDGKVVAETGVMRTGDTPQRLSVSLTGAKMMTLLVGNGGDNIDYDHANWADAAITLAPGATALPEIKPIPQTIDAAPRIKLVPASPVPAIHGARTVGGTPGRPFLFLISATGEGPLTYSATGLPTGLKLDSKTGAISGAIEKAGTSTVVLQVRGPKGTAERKLFIIGGKNKVAMTPPMGWNSWNVWGTTVDDAKVRAAADVMISSGLAGHGYQYVNIDDGWEAGRNTDGTIQVNDKFPSIKSTADYVHSKGLKFGIYSSPGYKTCGGYTGSLMHEEQDARSYADWGVDYLKYDWCSYEGDVAKGDHSLPSLKKPYVVMRDALDKTGRDIFYSLCQYGWGNVWEWGNDPSIRGNAWRTTGDIFDNWNSLRSIYESQAGHEPYAGPGHWNDPDMLMVGVVGFGNPHPTKLKPNEQILHMSLWCLLSSPLLIGCDMTKLDDFTMGLLSNDEAIDINQDPLAKPASRISNEPGSGQVWARPLFDGTHAVGLVNPNPWATTITVRWSDLKRTGVQPIRDIWLHEDIAPVADQYSVEVPAHGCVLLKIGKPVTL